MVNQLTISSFTVPLLWIYGRLTISSFTVLHTVLGLLGCWQDSFGCHRNGYIWSIVPHCLMWCLWRERNSRCFEDIERSIPDLKLFFFRTLLYWLFSLQKQSFPSFIDFLDSCNFSIWFVDPLYTPCVLGCCFFILIKLFTYQKKKKKKVCLINNCLHSVTKRQDKSNIHAFSNFQQVNWNN